MNEKFEATVIKESYTGYNGWIEEYYVSPNDNRLFEEILKKFEGKTVNITIQEID